MAGGKCENLKCSPWIEGLAGFDPERLKCPMDLYLDSNEGIGLPSGDFRCLENADPDILKRYQSAKPLRDYIAEMHQVDPHRVFVSAGADESIDRALRAMLCPGREMILPVPTFVIFRQFGLITGAEIIEVDWDGENFPTNEVLSSVTGHTSIIVVISPNNPTGSVISENELRKLSSDAPGALIVLDLAYIEFADIDLTQVAMELPNVLALRTMSKAWGLAGARVGYAIGPDKVVAWMRAVGGPYSVTGPSIVLAIDRFENYSDEMSRFVSEIKRERQKLTELITGLGWEPWKSQANFVLAKYNNADWVMRGMGGLGIAVKGFKSDPSLKNCVRITCPGDAGLFSRLENALLTVLKPEAILFDLEGTLYKRGSLTIRKEILKKISSVLKLGIVTGCGRSTVRGFIDEFGLEGIFGTSITYEDAPPKPSPEPVQLAMENLGVGRAWMVGDSVRDILAAREAGVVPIGISGHGDNESNLIKSGAGLVLSDPEEIFDILKSTSVKF
jgi:histidinol-phosphate aminotransferase